MDILSAFVHVHHGHAVPVEERRENEIPGESYSWLQVTMCELGQPVS